jgi:hypothetical protein
MPKIRKRIKYKELDNPVGSVGAGVFPVVGKGGRYE